MRLDEIIHELNKYIKYIHFKNINERYAYYYAENELYLIKDKMKDCYYFINAYNVSQALDKLLKENL